MSCAANWENVNMEIKLNDILRLTDEEIARTKVRFNADYDGEDAIDV